MFETLIKIRELLKNKFQGKVKTFIIGNPMLVPESSLPCLSIHPVSTETTIADTGRDLSTHTIEVRLIINASLEVQGKRDQLVGIQLLTETIEERETSGKLKSDTILNILRENLTLGDNWLIGNVSSVQYVFEQRGEQFFTKEAVITLTVLRIVNR
jgi:hypothetical protein